MVMPSIMSCTTFLAFSLFMFLQHVSSEQPVAMMHKSFFDFDNVDAVLDNVNEHERSKRAVSVPLSVADATEIVNLHNRFRGNVVPLASNMEFMKWDQDLATMAMRYSQKCHWGQGNVVNISPHSSVGQNLWIQGLSTVTKVPKVLSAINAWYGEVRNYNYDLHECTEPHQCGHYTQLVWAETTSVGCALSFCPRTTNWAHANSWIMTCYYGPAGNYDGVKPYLQGPSCTQCQSEVGQCYSNMCRLCSEHNEPCDCRQECVNCGTVDPFSCTCICQDGWYGPDCGKLCNETHPYCNKEPGWPGPTYCGRHPMIPKHCPKMCGLCVDPNPTYTCGPPVTVNPGVAVTIPPTPAVGTRAPVQPPAPPAGPPAGTLPPGRPAATLPPGRPAATLPPKVPVTPRKVPITIPPKVPAVTHRPRLPPIVPTAPRVPYNPGPTAVDCKIPCKNGGTLDIMTCTCTCTLTFTGTYCQYNIAQIRSGAMLRLVGDITKWGTMEYDMHHAIEQSVDTYCNNNVLVCCSPFVPPLTSPAIGQVNYLDMANVVTGAGFPEADTIRADSYWILLAATEPATPQLCMDTGTGGAAVQPSLLLSGGPDSYRYRRDESGESSEEGGGAGGPAPVYIKKAIMINSVDQNIAAFTSVLQMYGVTLAEVQRGQLLKASGSVVQHSPYILCASLVMFIVSVIFV